MTDSVLAKMAFGDSTRTNGASAGIPLPPDGLIFTTGSDSIESFLSVGEAWANVVRLYTPANATVLDIGCGCGRVARWLMEQPAIRRYTGFDVIRENVGWCRRFLAPRRSAAEFYWFDVRSETYNPQGTLPAREVILPCGTGTADIVFASSVFTHLVEADAMHYLGEIRRVLKPEGKALVSIHGQPAAGKRFSGTEVRIDIDPAYFVEIAQKAALVEFARRQPADPAHQIVFIFKPDGVCAAAASVSISELKRKALENELVALQEDSAAALEAKV